jgi:hypothetical protein
MNNFVMHSSMSRFYQHLFNLNISSWLRKTYEMKKLFKSLLFQLFGYKERCFLWRTISLFEEIFIWSNVLTFWCVIHFIIKKCHFCFTWLIIFLWWNVIWFFFIVLGWKKKKQNLLSTMYRTKNHWIWKLFLRVSRNMISLKDIIEDPL